MITNYRYKITYRRKSDNIMKLEHVRDFDTKLGKEVLLHVKGKPFISRFVRESYFLARENAERAYERLKSRDDLKYVKITEGRFAVEEISL